ncbi:MAG: mechanosensitive ion channel family protein, partial [Halarsenatibacteraceae bacterium]
QLFLPDVIDYGVYLFVLIATTIQFIIFIQFIIIYVFKKYLARQVDTDDHDKLLTITESFTKIVTWIIAVVFILDNLNIRISGLLAGLGVGGIAIGIASQSIFQDIFSYFTIFIDKPFEIGDFIIIGEFRGVVEYIGIKTTRLRSLSGEQLVFSNTDLTSSRIHNYRRMRQRRINFKFGVTYDTPLEQLKEIPEIVREIIESKNKAKFDRAHFHAYGDYSLIYEVIYYVQDKDYAVYMDIQQEINFELKEIFNEKDISFAFPTQTINLNQDKLVQTNNKEE